MPNKVDDQTRRRAWRPSTGTALFPDAEQPMSHPGWLPDGRIIFSMDGGIYAALPYTGPDQFVELVPPGEDAVHPAAGAGLVPAAPDILCGSASVCPLTRICCALDHTG